MCVQIILGALRFGCSVKRVFGGSCKKMEGDFENFKNNV